MKKFYVFAAVLFFIMSSLSSLSQNSISFDGTNDQVDCGNNTSVQITGTTLTLEAWIYPTSWKSQIWQGNIINKESLAGGGYMLRCGAGGKLNFNIGSGPGPWNEITSTTNILTLNAWQHVAGTYDGTWMRIYLNGVIVDSLAKSILIVNSTSSLGIGYAPIYAGSRNFPGKIDEVRIWNITRTKDEIAANMNNELCIIPSSVKAYYTFNHGIASGTNTSITTVTDLSGNVNTGTLTNFALTGSTSNWVTGQTLTPGAVVSSNNISACGSYTMPDGRIITTPGTYYDTLPSSTPCDSLIGYVITFPPAIISNTVTDSGCITYVTPMGTVISSTGTYYDTVSNASVCDTTIRYNITISGAVDDSVFRVGGRITSFDTWADHQWVRCDSNYAPISGATGRFYVATKAGDYAVIVKRGICVDTSDCVNITLTSIENNSIQNLEVYPNPATSLIQIVGDFNQATYTIYSVNGQLIDKSSLTNSNINISELDNGVYFLEIEDKNKRSFTKFVKQ